MVGEVDGEERNQSVEGHHHCDSFENSRSEGQDEKEVAQFVRDEVADGVEQEREAEEEQSALGCLASAQINVKIVSGDEGAEDEANAVG